MNSESTATFLLVDDMEENLLALEGLLRRKGLELLKARSGMEALELLLEKDVALAIVDVQMPEMDGFELAEIMRSAPRTRHIPIIFLTAGAIDDRRRFRGYEAGAVDFLFKPIEPTVLHGKADVFYDLYCERQEVIRQRDELRIASQENARLYEEILKLNQSLEERVKERTGQLQEANEQLNGFTYSIAHDFRQHIRNINTNAEIILSEENGQLGQFKENVLRMRDVAKLMNQMTDDLLTYARIRNVKLRPVQIDLSQLSEEIAEVRKGSYPKTEFVVEPGLEICGDATMIRIVLENLIDNAFKYSQYVEAPKVSVGRDEEGIFVRDNGVGLDLTYSDKLFRPFERLSASSEFKGAGMGLANVKRILERHHGKVSVASKLGEGTIFHFSVN